MNQDQPAKIDPNEPIHEVDGIIELNHPAPFWWQAIYYASIVWAVAYAGYYLSGAGRSIRETLALDLARLESARVAVGVSPEAEKGELRAVLKDPRRLLGAKAIFSKNCSSCHGPDGGGGIGPNLTDAHWIHGDGSVDSILKIVREGVAEKGMPPWGPLLKREDVVSAAAFVRSLRGTASAHPKAPQGNPIRFAPDL